MESLFGGLPAAWQLAAQLLVLSAFAVGGAHTVFPDVYRFIVDDKQFFTGATFASLVALSQAAPGPNMLVFAMFGYQLGGVTGAAANTLAFCLIPFAVSYGIARIAHAASESRWSAIIKAGLAPLTVGVVLASGCILAQGASRAANDNLLVYILAGLTAIAASLTRWNPLWLLVAGAGIAMIV